MIAIYARVSPTRKENDEFVAVSIKKQLEVCRNAARGEKIFAEYADQYVSGKAQEYMTEFNRMVEDAKKGCFDRIFCARVDRFGRNLQQMLNTQKELQAIGVHIKFVEQGVDTGNQFGRMVMGIMASIAEWQREVILTNTRLGREIAKQKHPEKFGRPQKKIDWEIVEPLLVAKTENGEYRHSWRKIAKKLGITAGTLIRRYKKKYGSMPMRRV